MKFEDEEIKKVFKEEAKPEAVEVKRFPVLMKNGYFPEDPTWPKDPMTGYPQKILAGTKVDLPIHEARRLIKLGAAERADEIEI